MLKMKTYKLLKVLLKKVAVLKTVCKNSSIVLSKENCKHKEFNYSVTTTKLIKV